MGVAGAGQHKGMTALLAMGLSAACAHTGARVAERQSLTAGKYAVESIRSRATLDGVDRVIEISEQGTKVTDSNGAEHMLTERGALLLNTAGTCRLALAVSVDGENPGVSDRSCTWSVDGDSFVLGDSKGEGARTVYRIHRVGNHLVLEGVSDLDGEGKIIGDAKGERIVLVEGSQGYASKDIDRTSEDARASRAAADMLNEL